MLGVSLVAYSDSEADEPDADSAPPAVPVAPPAASTSLPTAAPPAKRPRMEVDLQALLQKHDVALPFEEAAKLPADFFDGGSTAIEPDAGKSAPKGGGGPTLGRCGPGPRTFSRLLGSFLLGGSGLLSAGDFGKQRSYNVFEIRDIKRRVSKSELNGFVKTFVGEDNVELFVADVGELRTNRVLGVRMISELRGEVLG